MRSDGFFTIEQEIGNIIWYWTGTRWSKNKERAYRYLNPVVPSAIGKGFFQAGLDVSIQIQGRYYHDGNISAGCYQSRW